jgi:hypothetical protein
MSDARSAVAVQALSEDPPDMVCGGGVGFQTLQPAAPPGMRGVGMWAGVGQAVAVGWAAAQVAALLLGLGLHRGQHPKPSAQHFPLGLRTQQHHQRLMNRVSAVDGTVGFRQPQLHPVRGEQRQELGELVAEERPLILADHHSLESTIGIGKDGQQGRRLRPVVPGKASRIPTIKELRDDSTLTGDQFVRGVALPGTRRRMILEILRRDPTVEREPYSADRRGSACSLCSP